MGRLDIERVCSDGVPVCCPARGPGGLARVGPQSGRTSETAAANSRLRPGHDDARTDALEPGGRADRRGPLRYRAARLPADHGWLADGAGDADDGVGHVPDHLVPPAPLTARLAGHWGRGDRSL